MMPMQTRRKGWKVEKVENLYRTATAQKILPNVETNQITLARFCECRVNVMESAKACRIPLVPIGLPLRSTGPSDIAIRPAEQVGLHQPLAGSQPLPDMSQFAAEFYECCANLSDAF